VTDTSGAGAHTSNYRALNVMIVEDEALIAMDLQMQVEMAGHEVVAMARSAVEAIQEGSRARPDVVLMDLRLANGSSCIDAARRLYEDHAIRCVFLSGNLDPATRARLTELAPIDMLSKPITPTQLRKALDGVGRAGG
jgi:DNA-binding NarL/FixJ family response regulator